LKKPTVFAGDYNVIPTDADVHDPALWANDALFLPRSREKFQEITHLGLTDAIRATSDDPGLYTFWDYQGGAFQKNNGIRIDHLLSVAAGGGSSGGCRDRPRDARRRKAFRSCARLGRSEILKTGNCNVVQSERGL
jgi:hypothetical protein